MDDSDIDVRGFITEALEPAPVGVAVTVGYDHRLLYANQVYRSMFGEPPLGVPIREAFSGLAHHHHFLLFDQVMTTGRGATVTDAPGDPTLLTPRGQERFFSYSLSPVIFDEGVHGLLVVCVEVTEQISSAQRIQTDSDTRGRILRRYQSLVRASAQIIWTHAVEGGVLEPTAEWERVTGQTWEEYRGFGWLKALHPDDREPTRQAWEQAIEEVPGLFQHVYRLRTVDSGYRHFLVRAVPVIEDDQVVEWVGTCTDIEPLWEEKYRRSLLDRAAAAITNQPSLEKALSALAGVIVPELADGCAVHLVTNLAEGLTDEPSLVIERVATASAPGLPPIPPFPAQRLALTGSVVRAVQSARPILRTFPRGSPPDDIGAPGTYEWLKVADANCLAILPVLVDGSVAAMITAATCGDRPPIKQSGVDLLKDTFEQAHAPLTEMMRFQRTRRMAFTMQHSLLPAPPRVPGLEIVARYRPSLFAAEVGGDWYDSFVLPDGVTVLVIGDVAGHDLHAAVTMGQLRNMLRALVVDRREPPGEVLERLNVAAALLQPGEETATCILARVEHHEDGHGPGHHELSFSVAGHPPPLLVTEDGEGRFLEAAVNPMLGVPYLQSFTSAREPLPPRGTLLFYTDGLVERPGEDIGDGLLRLRDQAVVLARAPLDEFCDELLNGMPVTRADDVAMIALRVSGGRSAGA
ncbi:SpoIIE family protein phosphatase [Nonomuraea sp. NPDC048826]|uniref:SpoIIE family protein phosphatase n=1 Tax=Nonomuraea sp. NPDC048826 TaxID=3364347 RepID=UPI0037243E77